MMMIIIITIIIVIIIIIIIIIIIMISKTEAIFVLYSMSFYFIFALLLGFMYVAQKFPPSLKLFRSCPLLKVVHTHQHFLEQNSKVLSSRSMEQRGEGPYAKRGEETILIRIFSVFAK